MEIPIYYDYATQLQNVVSPGSVHAKDALISRFYTDYLLKRAMSVLEFNGVPENWDMNYFMYILYCRGFVCVMKSKVFGVIPQECNLSGYNIYRAPTTALVANPALPIDETGRYWLADAWNREKHPDVKDSAVLIKLQPNFHGILDICSVTAERLALMHEALMMNLANSKLAYIIGAADKNAADTFKAAVDFIQEGNLVVAAGRNLWDKESGKPLWEGFANNLRQNYIATDILENMRSELNDFNNFIGIPSTNYNKKAHMTEQEISANDVETESLVDVMFDCVKTGVDKVNSKYGLSLSVKKRYEQEVLNDVESESDDSRPV